MSTPPPILSLIMQACKPTVALCLYASVAARDGLLP